MAGDSRSECRSCCQPPSPPRRLVAHRTLKRHVVRGSGRAQPAYLRTRGKSRAGSRLRLRNARRLLEDIAATLSEWRDRHGPAERVFRSAPVRAWAELLREKGLTFDRDQTEIRSVPLDLRPPTHAEMLRAFRALAHGSLLVTEQV